MLASPLAKPAARLLPQQWHEPQLQSSGAHTVIVARIKLHLSLTLRNRTGLRPLSRSSEAAGLGGVAAGAAAGQPLATCFRQSGSSSPAPAAAPAPAAPATASDAALGGAPAQQSSFPWGMLFLLGVGLAGFYLRRKSATAGARPPAITLAGGGSGRCRRWRAGVQDRGRGR